MTSPWRYRITEPALCDLRRVDTKSRERIFAALDRLVADPRGAGGDVRKLRGPEDEWRLRIGDWRIRFEWDEPNQTVWVLRVLLRGRAYRR